MVVGPAWVGDMVMAQSLFMTLRQQNPQVKIDVLAPAWSLPILARMPEVDASIAMPLSHGELGLRTRYRLGKQLRNRQYDQAIILPRSWKAALPPFVARIPRRTGYRGEMRYGLINDMRSLDKQVLSQTVQRQVALGLPADTSLPPATPYPQLSIDPDNQNRLLKEPGLATDKPVIGFMPGAEYGPAKQWPLAHFRELGRALVDKGYRIWVFGSEKEYELAEQIAADNNDIVNLCGKTRLEDAVDLIALCDKVVSNDSGLMHVACASGVPVVAIYGSSSPAYTPPLSGQASIVYRSLDCSPCFARTCRFGHTACLTGIESAEVLRQVQPEHTQRMQESD